MDDLVKKILSFRDQRDWQQFHSPKNLAVSLSIEAAEVLEHFQWMTVEESSQISSEKLSKVSKEIADVGIYLMLLSHELGIDLLDAIDKKIDENDAKYPVEKAKGNATKYTEL